MTRPIRRTGAQIIVDQRLIHGATLGFGVPGESSLSACHMADAPGKRTGAPGLCFATRGPGAAQPEVA